VKVESEVEGLVRWMFQSTGVGREAVSILD